MQERMAGVRGCPSTQSRKVLQTTWWPPPCLLANQWLRFPCSMKLDHREDTPALAIPPRRAERADMRSGPHAVLGAGDTEGLEQS